jgi:hypothetical protein
MAADERWIVSFWAGFAAIGAKKTYANQWFYD